MVLNICFSLTCLQYIPYVVADKNQAVFKLKLIKNSLPPLGAYGFIFALRVVKHAKV